MAAHGLPRPSSPEVTRRMQQVRRRDTGPELRLRSELHRRGLRFRVDAPLPFLPRHRVDVLFGPVKVAVYVDGCFWHGCPEHGSIPKSNVEWWREKIARVRRRDAQTNATLQNEGWEVIRVWEHEQTMRAADRVESVLNARRQG